MFPKKGMGKLSPVEQEAKSSVLEDMKKMAEGAMGDKLKGLKKVTVASNDPSGLKAGLEKAKQMVGGDEGSDDEAVDNEDTLEGESGESMTESDSEMDSAMGKGDFDHMSEEEVDQALAELMARKEKMKAKV